MAVLKPVATGKVKIAAPLAIVIGLSYIRESFMPGRIFFGGFYSPAAIVVSYYIFSFWLTLAIYARRGKLADPGGSSVKFNSRVLLFWLFFIYVPLLAGPLDLIVGVLILMVLRRNILLPRKFKIQDSP